MTHAEYDAQRAPGDADGQPAASVKFPYQPPGKATAPFDPLRLCIFATIALLGWLAGPVALLFFAVLGLVGYARARKAGLLTSRCVLGDTRIVIAYLSLLVAAAGVGIYFLVTRLL